MRRHSAPELFLRLAQVFRPLLRLPNQPLSHRSSSSRSRYHSSLRMGIGWAGRETVASDDSSRSKPSHVSFDQLLHSIFPSLTVDHFSHKNPQVVNFVGMIVVVSNASYGATFFGYMINAASWGMWPVVSLLNTTFTIITYSLLFFSFFSRHMPGSTKSATKTPKNAPW